MKLSRYRDQQPAERNLAKRSRVPSLPQRARAETLQQTMVLQEELLLRKQLETLLRARVSELSQRLHEDGVLKRPVDAGATIGRRELGAGRSIDFPSRRESPFRPAYLPYLANTLAHLRMQSSPSRSIGNRGVEDGNAGDRRETYCIEMEDSVVEGALRAAEASLKKEKEDAGSMRTAVSSSLRFASSPAAGTAALAATSNFCLEKMGARQPTLTSADANATEVRDSASPKGYASMVRQSENSQQHQRSSTLADQQGESVISGLQTQSETAIHTRHQKTKSWQMGSGLAQRYALRPEKPQQQPPHHNALLRQQLLLQQLVAMQQQVMQQQQMLLQSSQGPYVSTTQLQRLHEPEGQIRGVREPDDQTTPQQVAAGGRPKQHHYIAEAGRSERRQHTDKLKGLSRLQTLLQQSQRLRDLQTHRVYASKGFTEARVTTPEQTPKHHLQQQEQQDQSAPPSTQQDAGKKAMSQEQFTQQKQLEREVDLPAGTSPNQLPSKSRQHRKQQPESLTQDWWWRSQCLQDSNAHESSLEGKLPESSDLLQQPESGERPLELQRRHLHRWQKRARQRQQEQGQLEGKEQYLDAGFKAPETFCLESGDQGQEVAQYNQLPASQPYALQENHQQLQHLECPREPKEPTNKRPRLDESRELNQLKSLQQGQRRTNVLLGRPFTAQFASHFKASHGSVNSYQGRLVVSWQDLAKAAQLKRETQIDTHQTAGTPRSRGDRHSSTKKCGSATAVGKFHGSVPKRPTSGGPLPDVAKDLARKRLSVSTLRQRADHERRRSPIQTNRGKLLDERPYQDASEQLQHGLQSVGPLPPWKHPNVRIIRGRRTPTHCGDGRVVDGTPPQNSTPKLRSLTVFLPGSQRICALRESLHHEPAYSITSNRQDKMCQGKGVGLTRKNQAFLPASEAAKIPSGTHLHFQCDGHTLNVSGEPVVVGKANTLRSAGVTDGGRRSRCVCRPPQVRGQIRQRHTVAEVPFSPDRLQCTTTRGRSAADKDSKFVESKSPVPEGEKLSEFLINSPSPVSVSSRQGQTASCPDAATSRHCKSVSPRRPMTAIRFVTRRRRASADCRSRVQGISDRRLVQQVRQKAHVDISSVAAGENITTFSGGAKCTSSHIQSLLLSTRGGHARSSSIASSSATAHSTQRSKVEATGDQSFKSSGCKNPCGLKLPVHSRASPETVHSYAVPGSSGMLSRQQGIASCPFQGGTRDLPRRIRAALTSRIRRRSWNGPLKRKSSRSSRSGSKARDSDTGVQQHATLIAANATAHASNVHDRVTVPSSADTSGRLQMHPSALQEPPIMSKIQVNLSDFKERLFGRSRVNGSQGGHDLYEEKTSAQNEQDEAFDVQEVELPAGKKSAVDREVKTVPSTLRKTARLRLRAQTSGLANFALPKRDSTRRLRARRLVEHHSRTNQMTQEQRQQLNESSTGHLQQQYCTSGNQSAGEAFSWLGVSFGGRSSSEDNHELNPDDPSTNSMKYQRFGSQAEFSPTSISSASQDDNKESPSRCLERVATDLSKLARDELGRLRPPESTHTSSEEKQQHDPGQRLPLSEAMPPLKNSSERQQRSIGKFSLRESGAPFSRFYANSLVREASSGGAKLPFSANEVTAPSTRHSISCSIMDCAVKTASDSLSSSKGEAFTTGPSHLPMATITPAASNPPSLAPSIPPEREQAATVESTGADSESKMAGRQTSPREGRTRSCFPKGAPIKGVPRDVKSAFRSHSAAAWHFDLPSRTAVVRASCTQSPPPTPELITYSQTSYKSLTSVKEGAARHFSPDPLLAEESEGKPHSGESQANGDVSNSWRDESVERQPPASSSWRTRLFSLPLYALQSLIRALNTDICDQTNKAKNSHRAWGPEQNNQGGLRSVRDALSEHRLAHQRERQSSFEKPKHLSSSGGSTSRTNSAEGIWTVRAFGSFTGTQNGSLSAAGGPAHQKEGGHQHSGCAPQEASPACQHAVTKGQKGYTWQMPNLEDHAHKLVVKSVTQDGPPSASGGPETAITGGCTPSASRILPQRSDGEVVDTGFGGSGQLLVAITSPPPPQLLQELVCATHHTAISARPLVERPSESTVARLGAAPSHPRSTATMPTLPDLSPFCSGDSNAPTTPVAWSLEQQLSTQLPSSHQQHDAVTPRFAEARSVASGKPPTPSEGGSCDRSRFILPPLSRGTLCILSPNLAQFNRANACAMPFPSLLSTPSQFVVKQSPKGRKCSTALADDQAPAACCRKQRLSPLLKAESTDLHRETLDSPLSTCAHLGQAPCQEKRDHEPRVPVLKKFQEQRSLQQALRPSLLLSSMPRELSQRSILQAHSSSRQQPHQQTLLDTFQEAPLQHWLSHLSQQESLQPMHHQVPLHLHRKPMQSLPLGISVLSHQLAHEIRFEGSFQKVNCDLSEKRLHLRCSREITTQQPALKEPLQQNPQPPKLQPSSQLPKLQSLEHRLQQEGQDGALCPQPPLQPKFRLNQQTLHHEASPQQALLQEETLEDRLHAKGWGQSDQGTESPVAASPQGLLNARRTTEPGRVSQVSRTLIFCGSGSGAHEVEEADKKRTLLSGVGGLPSGCDSEEVNDKEFCCYCTCHRCLECECQCCLHWSPFTKDAPEVDSQVSAADGFGLFTKGALVEVLEALQTSGHLTVKELQALVPTVAQGSGKVQEAMLAYCGNEDSDALVQSLKAVASASSS
ncbi:hypothetical protein Esti_001509 [Eimeria stiedai]